MHYSQSSKKLLTSCLFLCLCVTVFAQAKKGIKLLAKGQFEAAKSELLESLNDEKERPVGFYGLAQLYLTPQFSGYEPDSAMSYIGQADEAYRALGYKEKSKIQKDVNISLFRKLKKQIAQKASERAKEENTLEAYQHFLDFYPKPGYKLASEMTKSRNKLAFDAAKAEGTWEAWAALIDQYGPSLKEKNPERNKEAEMALFETYHAAKGLQSYDSFVVLYPKNIYVRDSLMHQFKSLAESNKPSDYQSFISENEGSPYAALAKDSLTSKLIQYGGEKELITFIGFNPKNKRLNELKHAHYRAYLKENPTLEAVEYYTKRYPDYPFREEVAADKEKYKAIKFDQLMSSGALQEVKRFLENYRNYPENDRLWGRYYELYKAEHPEPEAIDRFVARNPDFPFRDRVEADKLAAQKMMEEEQYVQLQNSNKTTDYYTYLDNYPDGKHKEKVIRQLGEMVSTSGSKTEIRDYLSQYPESPQREELAATLYDLIAVDEDLKEIIAFQKDFPDYPDQARINRDKEKALLTLGELGNYTEDKRGLFEVFIEKKAPAPEAMQALRKMLQPDLVKRKWKEAGEKIEGLKPFFKNDKGFEELYGILTAPDQNITPRSIGAGINSDKDEYASTMSADGKLLYFCRNMGGIFRPNEDIYISRKVDGKWLEAKPVDELNSTGNEAAEGISADGNQMIVFKNGKLCTTEKTANGWSDPVPLPATINRSDWQADARITADGKAILFSSGTNWGQKDIYVSELQANGQWGPAKSLGPTINTNATDRSAFLHPDMKTLYFSSEGRNGLGGLDVYVSKRMDDSWTNWSEPINMGTAINTADNDWGFKVTTEGDSAYFAVEGSTASSDIYIVKVPEVYQPQRVATIEGKIVALGGKPVAAEIEWIDLKTSEVVQITRNDPETGDFFATLPNAGTFGYSIRKEGFFPLSGNITIGDGENKFVLEEAMKLATVAEMKEKEIKIPLNNLFFETASFDIEATSFPQLDRLVKWIKENNLAIEIQGHTDNVGAAGANQQLSENRAKAVRQYLIQKGVSEDKVSAAGYGENKPVASNDIEEGRAQNRRVEIQLK